MKRRLLLSLVGAAAATALAVPALAQVPPTDCEVPSELLRVPVGLPHLAARLRAKQAVQVVAIGGGSTRGAAAGAPEFAYPHRLQLALAALYPEVPIIVVNKGVPRQSTQQMVDRFPADVIAEHPVLVVWETGINDAVRGVAIDDFAVALQAGIDAVKGEAIDILLVDMQFSHRTSTLIDFDRYLTALHRIGDLNEVYVFPRFEIMRYWSEQHMFNLDDVAAAERTRLAAKVYDCLGGKLAQAIRRAVQ